MSLQSDVKRTLAGMTKALQAVEELRETVEGVQLKQQVRGGDEGDGCGSGLGHTNLSRGVKS